eukprot:2852623-Rhodomonas_salina.1
MVGLPRWHHSIRTHAIMAVEQDRQVLTMAKTAMPSTFNADPPVLPNHPNHSMPVPSATKARLCGVSAASRSSSVEYLRCPTTATEASAAKPAETCTTIPPAKSFTPHLLRNPSGFQI